MSWHGWDAGGQAGLAALTLQTWNQRKWRTICLSSEVQFRFDSSVFLFQKS